MTKVIIYVHGYLYEIMLHKIVTVLLEDFLSFAGMIERSCRCELPYGEGHLAKSWRWAPVDRQQKQRASIQQPARNWMLPTTICTYKWILIQPSLRWDSSLGKQADYNFGKPWSRGSKKVMPRFLTVWDCEIIIYYITIDS